MKIEKIKPIPKYILARIKKADKQNNATLPHRTRFYAYLTKNDGELVKVTVAVKYRYKKWLYKQVAVHGIHSDLCFVKDMVFYNIWGYFVGWYEQGAQKNTALVRKHRMECFRRQIFRSASHYRKPRVFKQIFRIQIFRRKSLQRRKRTEIFTLL